MTEYVHDCTSSSGHRWTLCIAMWGRRLHITARCVWQECEVTIEETEIVARLNAAEKTKIWLRLDTMFRLDPDISLDEVDDAKKAMREAYASILEGK